MVAAKEWTMKYPKYDKILTLMTRMYDLDKSKTSEQQQSGASSLNHFSDRGCYNGKGRDPPKIYVEGIKNL